MVDFDASTKEHRVQAKDKDTGVPVWTPATCTAGCG